MQNKEQVYDAHIAPLMAKVIAVCQANGIAMLSSFSIPTPEDAGLCCTTLLPDQDGANGYNHMEAIRLLRNQEVTHSQVVRPDGTVTMTAFIR